MKSQPFEANVRFQERAAVIDLLGEINAFAEPAITAAYHQAEANSDGAIILNFVDVTYINSTGIALIVSLLALARKSHRRLVVYGLNDHYTEIFRITRLSDFMSFYSDENSALEDLKV
jgi:anti-anti-sigma factor